jgi:hypothetical protein
LWRRERGAVRAEKIPVTADKSRPGPSPELFKGQNVHIVFLELDRRPAVIGTCYTGVSQDYGASIATPAAQEKTERCYFKCLSNHASIRFCTSTRCEYS